MSKYERTGASDQAYKDWHRKQASNLYMTDIDYVWYNGDLDSVAYVETKHPKWYFDGCHPEPGMTVIAKDASKLGLPFFVIVYFFDGAGNADGFIVLPWNDIAKRWLPKGKKMSEKEMLEFEHTVRAYKLCETESEPENNLLDSLIAECEPQ